MKIYKTPIYKYVLVREADSETVKCKITDSSDVAEYMKEHYYNDDLSIYESFFIILLNNHNNTIGVHKISQGGITATHVDIRLIAKYALDRLAVAVILIHNHPSENFRPSEADKIFTSKIKNGLEILDIKVLDHIILTEESYYSFADECIL